MSIRSTGTGLTLTHVNLLDDTAEGVECAADRRLLDAVPPGERPGSAGQRLFVQDSSSQIMEEAAKMPKRTDIKKVLVIGSGPIVIGQAAEFDYAGTQACLALKEEGYEVILVNSNPATIMTDTAHCGQGLHGAADAGIRGQDHPLRASRTPSCPALGGQTGLNLAMQLAKKGVLKECQVRDSGHVSFESIERAEDRELFKELCEALGEPVLPSHIAMSIEEAVAAAEKIGYPVVLRPAFTLGGTGGGFADDEDRAARDDAKTPLRSRPVHQVLVEKSIKGYKEIEYEVMRDRNDTAITICSMENIDPGGHPHRRLHRRRPEPDAHQQGVPACCATRR